ncbi:MAG: hypothetical protein ABIO70_07155 [Pseudomonadota bacterium]
MHLRRTFLAALACMLPAVAHATGSVEAAALVYPWGPGTTIGGAVSGDHLFAALDARGAWGGAWYARVIGGADVFSSDKLDLTAAAFVGGASAWPYAESRGAPMIGYEVGLGLGVGPVKGRYRHLHGLRPASEALTWGCETCPRGPWYEDQFRLQVKVSPKVSVFGDLLLEDPCRYDETDLYAAWGLGGQVTW